MHLSVRTSQSIEDNDAPVNPDQSPADMLMLSFTDSDLACMASAYSSQQNSNHSLRLTSLAPLKHPLSVDLYIEQVASHAKIIVVRLLGGYEWWKYGVDEFARIAREKNIALIIVPGCAPDPRLAEFSTASPEIIAAVDRCLAQGGAENANRVLSCMQTIIAGDIPPLPVAHIISAGALYREVSALPNMLGRATIIFYRAHFLAADTAPIDGLLEALAQQGISTRAFMVASLKDTSALFALKEDVRNYPPDILIDATAFSAGSDAHPLAAMAVPILQVALANASFSLWEQSSRGLSTTDLAMHVVLPEADGRVFTRAISFKTETLKDAKTEFTHIAHIPEPSRINYVAKLASNWVRLAKKNTSDRRIALILSDYPDRAGRSAYAVGLDGPQSAVNIMQLLNMQGYVISNIPDSAGKLLVALQSIKNETYSMADYRKRFDALPIDNQETIINAWGRPEDDAFFKQEAFYLPCVRHGNMIIALQPDRGSWLDRKTGYHDNNMPPRHGYLAFYWWLHDSAKIDALIHLGTHGNLEWLPGKSVGLSNKCWPEIVLGAMPVIYPYIVSDPGEAAQAKRRVSAVILSHLTPPLIPVTLSPELAALETLVDEYSGADGLDARRMKLLREEIIHRARQSGLSDAEKTGDEASLMAALETHLCDIKEQRVGNGLHIFGSAPEPKALAAMVEVLHEISGSLVNKNSIAISLVDAAKSEEKNLLAALDGKFIMPSPGGSPVRGRLDILPTGRNMVTIDPRMIPTPTAATIGKRSAEEFIRRYVQDHGDWPKHVVIDIWGSATLRNGGDEIAQALTLMGVNPLWDNASGRITGFELIANEEMAWPRVDVSLRISGLFRDMFANLITLFDDAARAVSMLEGWHESWRIFGSAPGAYGAGVNALVDSGRWTHRDELGQAYLDASQYAYGRHIDGQAEPVALKECIAAADALIHVQDQREMDVLSGADFADNEGGFAAAAQLLGNTPALYHLDSSRPDKIKARTLAEEISLTLQARALGQEWITGQMRHGYAGAAAFADVVDQLFAFAATTNAVTSAQFDCVFDRYLHDETIRNFIAKENPDALAAIANRFEEAIRRDFWNPLRNSTRVLLDHLRGLNNEEAA